MKTYDIVYDSVYDIIFHIVYDVVGAYDMLYDMQYNIVFDVVYDAVYDIENDEHLRFKVSAPLRLESATRDRRISWASFTVIFLGNALP